MLKKQKNPTFFFALGFDKNSLIALKLLKHIDFSQQNQVYILECFSQTSRAPSVAIDNLSIQKINIWKILNALILPYGDGESETMYSSKRVY